MIPKQNNSLLATLDYFFVLRPMLFFPGWSTLLAGYFITDNHRLFIPVSEIQHLDFWHLFGLLIIFSLAMGMSFLLNQLQDEESDRNNKKLFIVSEGHIPKKRVVIEILILGILAIILGLWYALIVGIWLIVFMILTGIFYNFKPLRLKDKPWGSLFANSLMGFLAFAIGWSAVNSGLIALLRDAVPYVLFNTALYFYTTLPDMKGDLQAAKNTFAVLFGFKRVIKWAFWIYMGGLISAFFLNDSMALLIMLLSLPFFLITVWNKDINSAVRNTKFSILFFAAAVCLKWPFYLAIMIALFFFTRWYYRVRFNFDYPNFKGV